jgi:hypothetical protein
MLRFFRQIRQRLLTDNNFSKYLLYAIGEILLVVIGILIALQIDTWNKESNDRLLETRYLVNLKKELNFNIQLGNEQIIYSDFQIKNCELILDILQNNTPTDPMELAVALEHIGWNHEIIFVNDVWNELYATGNIGLIRNEKIKNRMTDLYNVMRLINKFQEHEWSSYNLDARRLIANVLPPGVRLLIDEGLEPGGFAGETIDIPNQEHIIEKLKGIEELPGFIVDIIQTRKTSNEFMLGQIEAMKSINNLIDQESN